MARPKKPEGTTTRKDGSRAEYMRNVRMRESSVGRIPKPANPKRRKACKNDPKKFLTSYMPEAFPDPFSEDHLDFIKAGKTLILNSGLFVELVYRGFGKSTIAEGLVLWAALYGHREFCPLIGANQSAAEKSIRSIRSELENNDLLLEDFPEVCLPVRALQGRAQRAKSQAYEKEDGTYALTQIEWKSDEMVLPSIEGSASNAVILTVYPIMSRKARGLRFKRADGRQVRPDFVLIDDPQDDEQARNPGQVKKILGRIHKGILMSGGHKKKISALIAATVIEAITVSVEHALDAEVRLYDRPRLKLLYAETAGYF